MPSLTIGSFYSGLSGLQLDIPLYQFPAPFQNATRLEYYASLFNSIEVLYLVAVLCGAFGFAFAFGEYQEVIKKRYLANLQQLPEESFDQEHNYLSGQSLHRFPSL